MSTTNRYMGQYEEDVPHGHGVYLFASGQAYEGEWRAGSKHGWCVYSLANGQQWAGKMGWAEEGKGMGTCLLTFVGCCHRQIAR